MNEITDLEIQKKNKKRVNIYLDEEFAFGLDIMTAAPLYRGQQISNEKIEELIEKDAYIQALNKSTRYLAARARSIKEMEDYLKEKEFPEKTISKVVDKLLKEKYLNDAEFARLWVESRATFNPKGTWALKQELRQKGVGDSEIEKVLTGYDDNQAAWAAVKRKIPLWKNLEKDKMRKKLYTFLSSRGFNYETTSDIYNKVVHETDE